MGVSFDPLAQIYPSQRYPIYARGGMVNCSSPQASAAGLEILQKGGNAKTDCHPFEVADSLVDDGAWNNVNRRQNQITKLSDGHSGCHRQFDKRFDQQDCKPRKRAIGKTTDKSGDLIEMKG